MTTLSSFNRSALAALCISLAACTGVDPPIAELSRAEASIAEAERDGGQEYGSAALEGARRNLAAAQRATANDDNEEASRLATQADVDAQLAQAQTDRGKSEASLREIDQGLNTLHDESTRNIGESTQGITK
jgi:hypothetical protein